MMKTGDVKFAEIVEYVKSSDETDEFKQLIASQYENFGSTGSVAKLTAFDGSRECLEKMVAEAKRLVADARAASDRAAEAKARVEVASKAYQKLKTLNKVPAPKAEEAVKKPAASEKKEKAPKKANSSEYDVSSELSEEDQVAIAIALSENEEAEQTVAVCKNATKSSDPARSNTTPKTEVKEATPSPAWASVVKSGKSWADYSDDEEEETKEVSKKSPINTKIVKNGVPAQAPAEAKPAAPEMKTAMSKSTEKRVRFTEKKQISEEERQEVIDSRYNASSAKEFAAFLSEGIQPCAHGWDCNRKDCGFVHVHKEDMCPLQYEGEVCKGVNVGDKEKRCERIHIKRCHNFPCQRQNCSYLHRRDMPTPQARTRFAKTQEEYEELTSRR